MTCGATSWLPEVSYIADEILESKAVNRKSVETDKAVGTRSPFGTIQRY